MFNCHRPHCKVRTIIKYNKGIYSSHNIDLWQNISPSIISHCVLCVNREKEVHKFQIELEKSMRKLEKIGKFQKSGTEEKNKRIAVLTDPNENSFDEHYLFLLGFANLMGY